jgi:uncharacterized damage-inducible protein DinB
MRSNDLTPDEYAPYQEAYISTLDNVGLLEELEISLHRFIHFVREVPMDKFDYRYAPGKWTIKDIIQHLIDVERIFAYRALAFARNDKTSLPGFEEADYAMEANGNMRHLASLLTELAEVRQSTITLFKNFNEEVLLRKGICNNYVISVRALGFSIIGHQNHHQQIYSERYLG